jgi:hypothetical protein
VLAIVLYGRRDHRLGATRGAALTPLVPVLAALLSVPLLVEWPSAATALAVVADDPRRDELAAGSLDGWRLGRNRGNFTLRHEPRDSHPRHRSRPPPHRLGPDRLRGNRLIVCRLRLGRDQREDAARRAPGDDP